jgi:hypothetical protein
MTSIQIVSPSYMGRSVIQHDPRSRDYPVTLATDQPLRNRTWRRPAPFDQGQTSSCVGQTMKGLLTTTPFTAHLSPAQRAGLNALDIYRHAQDFDEWPGANYDGTSALGACKYLLSVNLITGYRWCFGHQQIIDTISHVGPVGIGVRWLNGMMFTDPAGFIHATGAEVGGHEVELNGVNVKGKYVLGTNSWGAGWGVKGRFKLSWDDLAKLVDGDGDAVTFA